jgi:hypothetical protein
MWSVRVSRNLGGSVPPVFLVQNPDLEFNGPPILTRGQRDLIRLAVLLMSLSCHVKKKACPLPLVLSSL